MKKATYDFSTDKITVTELTGDEEQAHLDWEKNEIPKTNLILLRLQRNRLLAETDYLANSDVTMSDEMKTYRQALRDLPANTSDPANPTWPTKPGG